MNTPIPALLMARELNLGGLERDVSKFARYLPTYGIEPHVACFRPGGARWNEIEAAGLPVFSIPVTSFKSRSVLTGAKMLQQYISRHGIRVVHAFDGPTGVFGVTAARLGGTPVTLASQLCYRELVPPSIRYLLPILDRVATGTFVNCEAMAEHLVRDWKVSRGRVHLCYNGVETDQFHPRDRRKPSCVADASVVIGTVAVLRPEKDLPTLVKAFAEVLRTDSRARLLIVGEGPVKASLEQHAAELGIAHACVFQPASENPAEWMRAIDIFVSSSKSEAFSNALLEAMACGCCPVGSRVGGTPELISDGERGLLFEPGNAGDLAEKLRTLTGSEALRRRFSQAASDFVADNLTMDVAAAGLASIYKSLVQKAN